MSDRNRRARNTALSTRKKTKKQHRAPCVIFFFLSVGCRNCLHWAPQRKRKGQQSKNAQTQEHLKEKKGVRHLLDAFQATNRIFFLSVCEGIQRVLHQPPTPSLTFTHSADTHTHSSTDVSPSSLLRASSSQSSPSRHAIVYRQSKEFGGEEGDDADAV